MAEILCVVFVVVFMALVVAPLATYLCVRMGVLGYQKGRDIYNELKKQKAKNRIGLFKQSDN